MAQVPDDQIASVQQEPLAGRGIPHFDDAASPADFGAGLGQGLEQAGAQLQDVAVREAQQQKIAQDKANADADRVRLAGGITQLSQGRDSLLYGKNDKDTNAAYRQSGAGLADMQERYGQQFDQLANSINQTLTPHQQAMFAERVASEKDSFNLQLSRYQFEQGNREAVETFSNAAGVAIQSASNNYRDPAATPQARNDILNAGMALASRGGKDAVKAYQQSGYARDLDHLHDGVIGSYLADGNPGGAQTYLNQWGTDLSSGTVRDALQNKINAERDRLENKMKDTAHDHYNDALKCSLAGLDGCSGLVSDTELQAIKKNEWPRMREFLTKASVAGKAEKRFDTMNPADIKTEVEAGTPTAAAPGVGDDIELHGMVQRAADSSIARRNADPREFVTTTQKKPTFDVSQPIDQQLATLNSRFNTIPTNSAQIGQAVPPLSKRESAQFAQTLDAQDATTKLGILDQYRNGLGDRNFKSLMLQVRPDSPVTTKAALLLPRTPGNAPAWYEAQFDTNVDTAKWIAQGQDIINPGHVLAKQEGRGGFKGGMELPDDAKFRDAWNNADPVRKGVYNGRVQEADTSFEATKAYYAGRMASQPPSKEINPTIWKEAVKNVAGRLTDWNGSTVPVPRGMNPQVFPHLVNYQLRALEQHYGLRSGTLDGYGLQEVGEYGSGMYGVMHDGQKITDPKNPSDWLAFDLNRVGRNAQ